MKFKTLLSSFAGLAMATSYSLSANAALFLNPTGAPPFSITDSDALGLGEIGPTFSFDIVYDDLISLGLGPDLTGGSLGTWDFAVGIADPIEIVPVPGFLAASWTFDPMGLGVGVLASTAMFTDGTSFFDQSYSVAAPLAPGTIIASFSLIPGLLGIAPDDEAPDFSVAGFGVPGGLLPSTTIFDPAGLVPLIPGNIVDFDAQPLTPPS